MSETQVKGGKNDLKANQCAAGEKMKEEPEVIARFSNANEISIDAAVARV